MTDKEKLDLLKKWQELHNDIVKTIEDIETAFACNICESDIYNISWKTFQAYTEAISFLLCNDHKNYKSTEEWLTWYAYDNEMGKKEFNAKAGSWKKSRKINNLKLLLKAING